MKLTEGPGDGAGLEAAAERDEAAARSSMEVPARRRFLRVVGVTCSGALAAVVLGGSDGAPASRSIGARSTVPAAPAGGPDPPRGRGGSLTEAEAAVILQVARVGAVYPVRFPRFGERGPATGRATRARLDARLPELSAQRLGQVRDGAGGLIEAGLLEAPREALLDGIGAQVAGSGAKAPPGLTAVLALAIATVSKKFDPDSDGMAEVWLGTVRRRYQRLKR